MSKGNVIYKDHDHGLVLTILNRMVRDKHWIEFFRLSRMSQLRVSGTRTIMMEISNTWEREGDDDRISLRLYTENTPEDFTLDFTFKRPPRCAYVQPEEFNIDLYWMEPGEELELEEVVAFVKMLTKVFPEKEDRVMSSEELEMKYLERNGGYHPVYTVDMWQSAVVGNFTRDGYWDWVTEQFNHESTN